MREDIHWQKYADRFRTFPALLSLPDKPVDMAVCIPVYAEPELLATLESLSQCTLPDGHTEVLICFNKNDRMSAEEVVLHDRVWEECIQWIDDHKHHGLSFKPIYLETLPDPKGGVGWARKMVMDEAARRMQPSGMIVCLDGDCTVEPNYLTEIYQYFSNHPACDAASICCEHRYSGLDEEVRTSIIDYELHLRYLVHALRWTGHPFAYQTVGSSMAVRRDAYLAHGGMNTRSAGEDFYFLQKFIETESMDEITSTTVYPSARISYRVPFGTGRAMSFLLSEGERWTTTSFQSYLKLRPLFDRLEAIHQILLPDTDDVQKALRNLFADDDELLQYLMEIDFADACLRIAKHTASFSAFRKRFFRYFNAFRVIRYTHYMRDHYFPDEPVAVAVEAFLAHINTDQPVGRSAQA